MLDNVRAISTNLLIFWCFDIFILPIRFKNSYSRSEFRFFCESYIYRLFSILGHFIEFSYLQSRDFCTWNAIQPSIKEKLQVAEGEEVSASSQVIIFVSKTE